MRGSTTTAIATSSSFRRPAAHPRQLTTGNWNHTGVEWTPDGRQILFTSLRVDDADHQWRESDIYAVTLANGEIRQLTQRKGPDSNPTVSPDGKLVAYTGYDWTKDTYIDSKIYVMNIDGSNPRLASGTWDRSPQNCSGRPTAAASTSAPPARARRTSTSCPSPASAPAPCEPVTEGTHMLNIGSMTKTGKVAAVLTSFQTPPDVVSVRRRRAEEPSRQLTAVNADILAGKSSAR